jgi:hypothetical protein
MAQLPVIAPEGTLVVAEAPELDGLCKETRLRGRR